MPLYEVGQVGVRVRPLTKDFSSELHSRLERIERSLKVEVKVDLDESSFRKAQARLKTLSDTKIDIKADLSGIDVSGLSKKLKGVTASVDDLDTSVGGVAGKLEDLGSQKIELDADTQSLHDKLMNLKFPKPIEAPIKVPDVMPETNRQLKGLNLLPNFKLPNIAPLLATIGQMAAASVLASTAISGLTIAIGGLGIAVAAAVGPLFSLVSSLGPIAGLGLMLPAMLAGLIPFIATIVMVAADAGTELQELGAAFSELQQEVSFAFWDQARDAIFAISDAILPLANDYLPQVAIGLAGWVQNIAGVITSSAGLANIEAILSNLATAVELAGVGVGSLMQAFLNLAGAGSQYFPVMSEGFNSLMERFDAWTQRITTDGSFEIFVANAVSVFNSLMSVVGSLVGIIGSIGSAAQAAGHMTIQSLAGSLAQVDAALKTAEWQARMTAFFTVVDQGMGVISSSLGGLIVQLASMGSVFTVFVGSVSAAIASLVGGLTVALQNVQTQANFVLFFQQIEAAAAALGPAINPVLQIITGALTVMGGLLAVLAPVFTTFFTGVAGSFQALVLALQPVVELLGVQLQGAMLALLPVFQILVGSVLPILVATFGALLPILMPLAQLLSTILTPALQFMSTLLGLISPILGTVATLFSQWLTILQPVVATLMSSLIPALTSLAQGIFPIVQQAVQQIGAKFTELLTAIMPVVNAIIGLLGPALQWLVPFLVSIASSVLGDVVGAFTGLVDVIVGVVNTVSAVFRGDWAAAWEGLKQIVSGAVQAVWNLVQLWLWGKLLSVVRSTLTAISSVWTAGWNGVKAFASGIWSGIQSLVSSGIQAVRNVITSVLSGIRAGWSSTWTGIRSFASSTWTGIRSLISAAIQGVRTVITSVLSGIRSGWTSTWNAIKSLASSVWSGIKSLVSSGINAVRSTITSILTSIKSAWTTAWEGIKKTVSTIFETIKTVVSQGFNKVMDDFRAFPGKAIGALRKMIGQAKNVGRDIMGGLKDGILGAANGVIDAVTGAVQGAIDKAKSLLGIKSPSRVFRGIGEDTGAGWELGIDSRKSRVVNAVSRVGKSMIAAAPQNLSSTLSPTPGEGESQGNVYNLYLRVEDLEGVRAVEELARTLELKSRMAGREIL